MRSIDVATRAHAGEDGGDGVGEDDGAAGRRPLLWCTPPAFHRSIGINRYAPDVLQLIAARAASVRTSVLNAIFVCTGVMRPQYVVLTQLVHGLHGDKQQSFR